MDERPLSLSIWYPSEEQPTGTIGGNPVFEGASAVPDAPFPEDAFPLVVLSHGGLRSATDSGAWLSSSIARAGYVVVEVNAPRQCGHCPERNMAEIQAACLSFMWSRLGCR
jgi:predicted dienelactone hydrolase